jgi:N-acetylglucosaminyldiphosphoundecaprenol N-acetyl-beta-D-mannosaminyltransferase
MKRNIYPVLGVKVDNITKAGATLKLGELMELKSPSIICTPNVEFIVNAQTDEVLKKILNDESKLNLADGYGVLWSAKYLSIKLPKQKWLKIPLAIIIWVFSLIFLPLFVRLKKEPLSEKISGSDFIWDIAAFAAKNNHKLFLLGAAPTIAERTALRLQTDILGLKVGGVHSGRAEEYESIIEAINKSRADILLVAFGAPKQEKWLSTHLKKTCCKIGIGLGGSFDFIAGTQTRAPRWVQNIGFEWLYRLIKEPSRLKRQSAVPKMMWLTLLEKIKN